MTPEELQELSELEELDALEAKFAGSGTSEFAGKSPEARGELASERLGTPPASALDVAGNVGMGALQAAGDIPAGLEQMATRYLPLPDSFEKASEERIGEYERVKKGVLSQPGGTAGYVGGQIGTAFIPGAGPAVTAGKVASAVKPLAVGAGLTAVKPYESEAARAKSTLESVVYGAGVGVGMKGLGMVGKGIKRGFTGGEGIEATGERASRAAVAEKKGYILTLGEVSGNKRLQGLEDASEKMLGGTALAKIRAHNKENTNKILSRRIGEETPEISTEWLAKTSDDIGKEFDAVRALDETTGPINLDGSAEAMTKASKTGRLSGSKKIGSVLKEFKERYPDGMTWNEYADLRSEWAGTVIRSQDRDFAHRLGGFIGALDDAAAKAAPDAAPLKAAATKYREYLALRNSVDENGDIARGKFVDAVSKMKRGKFKATLHEEDELVDIARSLETFQKQIPSSGTAERTQAMKQIEAMGNLPGKIARVGATLGTGFALGDITGAVGVYAAPYLAQKALMSKSLQKYLTEKAPRLRELARTKKAETLSKATRLGALYGGQ